MNGVNFEPFSCVDGIRVINDRDRMQAEAVEQVEGGSREIGDGLLVVRTKSKGDAEAGSEFIWEKRVGFAQKANVLVSEASEEFFF